MRRISFRNDAEKYTKLQNIKKSLKETIRFFIITIVFVCLHLTCSILFRFVNPLFGKLVGIISVIYLCTNPYIYILMMSELRKEHKRLCQHCFMCCFCYKTNNSIGVASSMTDSNQETLSKQTRHVTGSDNSEESLKKTEIKHNQIHIMTK